MKVININGFDVGGAKTYVVADVGSNHMQDLQLAKESISAAKEAGVDAIKFQSIQLNELYLNPDKSTANLIRKLEFPEEWHYELKSYADNIGITFFSSPTYLKAIDLLEEVNVPVYKLASAQVGTFPQIIDKVASLRKPTILSTGITAIQEIEQVVSIFHRHGNDQFMILHCNSIYPTPAERVNLTLMKELALSYPNPIGFSDHTVGTHIACAAVTMGAKIIEKHFTLDRKFSSPDSNSFASDPEELTSLVGQIRDIEKSMIRYSSRICIEKEEQAFKNSITYKMVASKDLSKNSVLKSTDIKYLRAKGGINAANENDYIGRKLNAFVAQGELITERHIK